MNKSEALEKIGAIHAEHFDDCVVCPRCGEESAGLKVVDDLGICALATKCCGEPLSDYQMFPYADNE